MSLEADLGETDGWEWDDDKDGVNLGKHNIPLRAAELVAADPFCLDLGAKADERDGVRQMLIGKVGQVVLSCVYVWNGGRKRAISLRPASRKERRAYNAQVDARGNRG